MSEEWREQGQERYIPGLWFEKKKYQKRSDSWDHDHCEFCGIKISEDSKDEDGVVEGFATEDNHSWVCENCFNDFKEKYNLKEKIL